MVIGTHGCLKQFLKCAKIWISGIISLSLNHKAEASENCEGCRVEHTVTARELAKASFPSWGEPVTVGFQITARGNCMLAFSMGLAISGTCKFQLGVNGSGSPRNNTALVCAVRPEECANLLWSSHLEWRGKKDRGTRAFSTSDGEGHLQDTDHFT